MALPARSTATCGSQESWPGAERSTGGPQVPPATRVAAATTQPEFWRCQTAVALPCRSTASCGGVEDVSARGRQVGGSGPRPAERAEAVWMPYVRRRRCPRPRSRCRRDRPRPGGWRAGRAIVERSTGAAQVPPAVGWRPGRAPGDPDRGGVAGRVDGEVGGPRGPAGGGEVDRGGPGAVGRAGGGLDGDTCSASKRDQRGGDDAGGVDGDLRDVGQLGVVDGRVDREVDGGGPRPADRPGGGLDDAAVGRRASPDGGDVAGRVDRELRVEDAAGRPRGRRARSRCRRRVAWRPARRTGCRRSGTRARWRCPLRRRRPPASGPSHRRPTGRRTGW